MCPNSIRIVDRDNFKTFHDIEYSSSQPNAMAWSQDGHIFAAGDDKGKVKIFNPKSWMVEKEFEIDEPCVSIAFSKNQIITADCKGSVTLTDISTLKDKIKSYGPNNPKKVIQTKANEDFSDDDMDEDEPKTKNAFVNDQADEDDDADDADDLEALWNDEPDLDGGVENDDDQVGMEDDSRPADISLEAIKRSTTVNQNSDSEDDDPEAVADGEHEDIAYTSGAKIAELQPAFQSNSTPNFNAER